MFILVSCVVRSNKKCDTLRITMVTTVCGVTMEAGVTLLKWYGSYCAAEVQNKVETKRQLQFVSIHAEPSC